MERVHTFVKQHDVNAIIREHFHRQRAGVRPDKTDYIFRVMLVKCPGQGQRTYHAGRSGIGVLSVDNHHHKSWFDVFHPLDSSIQTEPFSISVKDSDPETFGPARLGQQQRPSRRFYSRVNLR